ncbi:MAG TPA: MBL fold metallo-hydrolase [Ktedonobacteraceae bacterium]|nr:MBL fold metallo-hydrolase [Ktedonobacteraceae bacterium]
MKISQHCYAITGLSFIPPWTVNAGFIAGGAATLVVDTGANMQAARTIYGYAKSARPSNTLLVINTERHLDHIGGNSLFRELGIDVYGHYAITRSEEDLAGAIAEMKVCIPSPVRAKQNEAGIFYASTHIVNPNRPISTEQSIDLGSFSVQVIFTPGHTATNISIFVPTDGVLFCGDCLVSAYLPNLEEGSPDEWQAWLSSLARIENLAPEIIVPGHGETLQRAEIAFELRRTRQILEEAIFTGKAPTMT